MDPAKVCLKFRKQCTVVIATIPTCGIVVWRLSWSSFIDLKPESLTSKERQVCVYVHYEEQICTATKILHFHRVHENSNIEAQAIHCTENKSDLCITKNETARPHSQFLHSCICERFMYSSISLPSWLQKNGRPILEIYTCKSLTYLWMWKLGCHAVSFLGTHKSRPNIYIGFSPALHLQCASVWVSIRTLCNLRR